MTSAYSEQLYRALLPPVRGQSGEAAALHPGLQIRELRTKAGIAGVGETLVPGERADQAD